MLRKSEASHSSLQYTLRYGIFDEIFEVCIYTKSMKLRKKQDNLRYVFIYKNPAVCVTRFFIEFLKFAGGRDIYALKKQCTLCDIFILKNSALCVTLLYTKSLTL